MVLVDRSFVTTFAIFCVFLTYYIYFSADWCKKIKGSTSKVWNRRCVNNQRYKKFLNNSQKSTAEWRIRSHRRLTMITTLKCLDPTYPTWPSRSNIKTPIWRKNCFCWTSALERAWLLSLAERLRVQGWALLFPRKSMTGIRSHKEVLHIAYEVWTKWKNSFVKGKCNPSKRVLKKEKN